MDIYGNVFGAGIATTEAIKIHGGQNNNAYHNLFIDSPVVIYSAEWPDNKWRDSLSDSEGVNYAVDQYWNRFDSVRNNPLYREKWPWLAEASDAYDAGDMSSIVHHSNMLAENLIIYAGRNLLNRENLIKFYHKQASYIFPARVSMCAEKIKLNIKAVKTGVFKTYWGSCGAGIIKLNERLVLSPLNTIDSIIYHELAHILVPNHSKEFYTVLEKIYPSYYKDHIWLTLFMHAEYPPKTVE